MGRELHTSQVDHCLSLSVIDEHADVAVADMVRMNALLKKNN